MIQPQLQILSDYIDSQPDLSSQPMNSDGDYEIARLLNLPSTSIVWRSLVPLDQVAVAFDNGELDAMSPVNRERLQTLSGFMPTGVNPAIPNVRAFFTDIFSGPTGQDTRAALQIVWARPCSRGEKLYIVGTGTSLSPAVATFEGSISTSDVNSARNL